MNALRTVLGKVADGRALNGDDLIALLLLAAMIISLAHLLTMVITRWGDRHIALKSLIASLLVHTVCFLGLEVFEPLAPHRLQAAEDDVQIPDVVAEVLIESEDQVLMSESGNTAVVDLPNAPNIELERTVHEARQVNPVEEPEREQEVPADLTTEAPDVAQFETQEPARTAIPVDDGRRAPQQAAAHDPANELDTVLDQSTADVYTPNTERTATERGNPVPDREPLDRLMASGATDRLSPDVVLEDATLPTVVETASTGLLPIADQMETVQHRSAPLSGTEPSLIAGIGPVVPTNRSLPSRSFESRLPRPERRRPDDQSGRRPVRTPSAIAQTPLPLTSRYDEVRIAANASEMSDSLMSAAKLVDIDTLTIRRRDAVPATYRLRKSAQRRDAAWKYGGTEQSERAVELSLQWLSSVQSADGHWDAETYGAGLVKLDESGVDRDYAGRDADTGITALVMLSFLGAGYTHEYTPQQGKYAVQVDRALDYLIRTQGADGNFCGDAKKYSRMYCHAMATYAIAEALGMQEDLVMGPLVDPESLSTGIDLAHGPQAIMLGSLGIPAPILFSATRPMSSQYADSTAYGMRKVDDIRLRSALLKAVTYTVSQQDPVSGGWRYKFGQEGDISMFGWQMMSLKSAEIAGVRIDPRVRSRMVNFLNSVRQGQHGGLFSYRRTEQVNPVMTAEALFCQQMLGLPQDSASSRESVRYLLKNMPRLSSLNLYYWYYGTLAMYQVGGSSWEEWNRVVRDTLVQQQRRDGDFAGSWDPNGPWGRYGGRLYSTAVATLTLEVYYRLLPLYRMNETSSDDL